MITVDTPPSDRKSSKVSYSNIASTIALVASILAVVFSWQQNNITKEHNRLSVKPILQLTPMVEGGNKRNGLYLSNIGLGPAIIKEFEVRTKKVVASGFSSDQWKLVLDSVGLKHDCFAPGWPTENTAIKASDEIALLGITTSDMRDRCMPEMIGLVGGEEVLITITYQSIYGDTYVEHATSTINSNTVRETYKQYKAYTEILKQLEKTIQ